MDVSDLYQVDITTLPTYPINAKYLQLSKECGPDSDFGLGPTSVSCADWPYRQVDPSKITTGPAVQRRYLADDYVPRYKYSNYMFDLRAPVSCCYFQTDGTRICGPQADGSVADSYIDDAFNKYFGGLSSAVWNQWQNDSDSNCYESGMEGEDCSSWNPGSSALSNAQDRHLLEVLSMVPSIRCSLPVRGTHGSQLRVLTKKLARMVAQ